jgi:preprotein translocase subunit SecE
MGVAMENAAGSSSGASESFASELFSARLYKPTQGRITRQITGGVVWCAFAVAAWRWWLTAYGMDLLGSLAGSKDGQDAVVNVLRWVLPGLLLAIGLWIGYRVVNFPRFADFLIAVEAEMNKVMWPSQDELVRSSVVVIILLLGFAGLMYAFDMLWVGVFWLMGIRA